MVLNSLVASRIEDLSTANGLLNYVPKLGPRFWGLQCPGVLLDPVRDLVLWFLSERTLPIKI